MGRPIKDLELTRGEFDVLCQVSGGTNGGLLRKSVFNETTSRKGIAKNLLWRGLIAVAGDKAERMEVTDLGVKAIQQAKY